MTKDFKYPEERQIDDLMRQLNAFINGMKRHISTAENTIEKLKKANAIKDNNLRLISERLDEFK